MVAFSHTLFAVGWLLAGAAAVAHERFAAVATGVILSPRQYQDHPPEPLDKRQGACSATSHPCNDFGPLSVGICCPNTHYCIIDSSGRPGCCFIGNTLCQSPCDATRYRCNATTTLTTTTNGSTITTASTYLACCARTCTSTSFYKCPTALGTGCCPYGAACGTNNQCFITPTASSPSPSVTIAPPGCTTGQISCAASLGGGCCAASQSCTLVDGGAHCADLPATPTGSDFSVARVDPGLTAGAKAGIAVGVVVGFGLLVGVATWVCLRRRKDRSERGHEHGGGGDGSSRPSRPRGVIGRVVGGSASGVGGGGGREMSEGNSDMMSSSPSAGGGRLGGLAQDYFGPAPAMGPYSEMHSTSGPTTPGLDRGGVPVQPHEPGDIAVPVEIDSLDSRLREARKAPAGLTITSPGSGSNDENDNEVERYELYGSDVGQISPSLPSPYNGALPSPPIDDRYR
ncbi:hypothetical protein C8A03DRAFT_12129 [Achaetomium macrosporum]|uniref:Uncharacterized protein n=1 Tax=Achaetomium macrosporum TaxID=79813 RepID=A0AAN7CHX6_9PEZI|nr:hypothetical protein C8A03DRAFT_12129 [Achaetomium macrosporum]